MHVLFIMPELRPSGAEIMFRLAAPLWKSEGVRLSILVTGKSLGPFAVELEKAGYSILHCRLDRVPSMRQIVSYAGKFSEIRPDVAHFNAEAHGALHMLPAFISGSQIVRTIHSSFGFDGFLRLRRILSRGISRLIGCRFIAISSEVARNESERFFNKTCVCNNWFDDTNFRPPTLDEKSISRARLAIPKNRIVLVSIGNSSPVKNYSAVISALAQCKMRSVHYHQVGNPDPTGKEADLARELGVYERVHFVGATSDVRSWLWAADIFIMPSIYEGFGLAAAEALSCGIPCVLSDIPGFHDFRRAGACAFWAEPRPEAITIILDEITRPDFNMPDLSASSANIRSKFSLVAGSQRYLMVWKSQTNRPIPDAADRA